MLEILYRDALVGRRKTPRNDLIQLRKEAQALGRLVLDQRGDKTVDVYRGLLRKSEIPQGMCSTESQPHSPDAN